MWKNEEYLHSFFSFYSKVSTNHIHICEDILVNCIFIDLKSLFHLSAHSFSNLGFQCETSVGSVGFHCWLLFGEHEVCLFFRDVSVELPFILMHPKPVEPPVSRPQSGEFTRRITQFNIRWICDQRSSVITAKPSTIWELIYTLCQPLCNSLAFYILVPSLPCTEFPWRQEAVSMETTVWHANLCVCVCVCVLQLCQRWTPLSTPIW